jgi:hypothetical protein
MNATFTNKEASFTQTPIPYPTLFSRGRGVTRCCASRFSCLLVDVEDTAQGVEAVVGRKHLKFVYTKANHSSFARCLHVDDEEISNSEMVQSDLEE